MVIAKRFLSDIGIDLDSKCRCLIDIFHNYIHPKSTNHFKDYFQAIDHHKDENKNEKKCKREQK